MKLQRGIIIIIDVSGYTAFVSMHGMSIIHAEWLISELMKSMAHEFKTPIKLNKLEGDAAMFFVPIAEGADDEKLSKLAIETTMSAFRAFKTTRTEMLAANLCPCCACPELDKLSVKAVFHIGEVVIKNLLGREELAGDTVIIPHRMLKNSLETKEYFMMTKDFYDKVENNIGMEVELVNEPIEGYQASEVAVIHGDALAKKIGDMPKPKASFSKVIKQLLNLQYYTLKRSARLIRKENFHHMPT